MDADGWMIIAVPIAAAVIAALPPTYVAWSARRKILELRVEVNGRLSQLLTETENAAGAEGEQRGREAAHRERSEREAD